MIDKTIFGDHTAIYHTFGCKLNFAETASLANRLAGRGIARAEATDTPDLIIINSCSVTELADKKCRQTVRSFAKKYPQAGIVLTGCYAQLKPDEARRLPGVVIVAGADQKGELPDMIERWLADGERQAHVSALPDIHRFVPSCSRGDRTRYFLKVQDGCNYYCSYCTIPMARGRSRSGEIADIVDQARRVAAEGGHEIVITGVNVGDFGRGRDDTFFDLIRRLDEVEGIERYRISSIEPNLLTDEILDFCASSPKFQHHFHIPLQSGSDRILGLMRRRYTTARFAERIAAVRSRMADAFIGIDVIVGFPGETEEDFRTTYDFLEGLQPAFLHIFPFSERPGTPAVTMPGKVQPSVATQRVARLEELCARLHGAFCTAAIGTEERVLFESTMRGGMMFGYTGNYRRVKAPYDRTKINTVCRVRLGEMDAAHDLAGEICE